MNKKNNNDIIKRCTWCKDDPMLIDYHDNHWGKFILQKQPLDDKTVFKLLCLEIFQAGLSWRTVLLKQSHMEKVFDDFDFKIIASYDDHKINDLLQDKGIIRHQGKIQAIIHNAKMVQELIKDHHLFFDYLKKQMIHHKSQTDTEITNSISKDLKQYGFKFIGQTTLLSLMQTIGFINGHEKHCELNK